MGTTMTIKERNAREDEVRKLIDDGKSIAEISHHLGVTYQATHKFLSLRGWLKDIAA